MKTRPDIELAHLQQRLRAAIDHDLARPRPRGHQRPSVVAAMVVGALMLSGIAVAAQAPIQRIFKPSDPAAKQLMTVTSPATGATALDFSTLDPRIKGMYEYARDRYARYGDVQFAPTSEARLLLNTFDRPHGLVLIAVPATQDDLVCIVTVTHELSQSYSCDGKRSREHPITEAIESSNSFPTRAYGLAADGVSYVKVHTDLKKTYQVPVGANAWAWSASGVGEQPTQFDAIMTDGTVVTDALPPGASGAER